MGQLSKATQQNASASEQLAATSEELSGQAEQLQESITFFKTGNEVTLQRKPPASLAPDRRTKASPMRAPLIAASVRSRGDGNFKPY
jgi:methyl-accepting chemotaxis protein